MNEQTVAAMGQIERRIDRVQMLHSLATDLRVASGMLADKLLGVQPEEGSDVGVAGDQPNGALATLDQNLDLLEREMRACQDRLNRMGDM